MFSQFQARYPMGSIVSELLQIHNGNYIVRAVVQVGGITLATGMAAAAEIDQAEDQARIRALIILGIYPSADQTQAYRIVDSEAETKLTSASLGSGLSNFMFENESEGALPSQSDISADWHKEEVAQPPSLSLPSQLPDQLTGPSVDVSKRNNQTGKAAQSSKASSKNGLQFPAGDATQTQPIDLSDAIAQTSVELRRLNWSNTQGRNYLQQTYGKRSRQQLTDEELLEFLHYLQSQPSEDELSF